MLHGEQCHHRQQQFRQRVVLHSRRHGHVHGYEGDEGRRAQRQGGLRGEDRPHQPVGDQQQHSAQGHREQPQRQRLPPAQPVHRHGQQVVERRLVGFIADGVNGKIRREATGLDLLQVLVGIITHLQDGEAPRFGEMAHVVVMRWLIRHLPGRGVDGVENAYAQVDQEDDGQDHRGSTSCLAHRLIVTHLEHKCKPLPPDRYAVAGEPFPALPGERYNGLIFPLLTPNGWDARFPVEGHRVFDKAAGCVYNDHRFHPRVVVTRAKGGVCLEKLLSLHGHGSVE